MGRLCARRACGRSDFRRGSKSTAASEPQMADSIRPRRRTSLSMASAAIPAAEVEARPRLQVHGANPAVGRRSRGDDGLSAASGELCRRPLVDVARNIRQTAAESCCAGGHTSARGKNAGQTSASGTAFRQSAASGRLNDLTEATRRSTARCGHRRFLICGHGRTRQPGAFRTATRR